MKYFSLLIVGLALLPACFCCKKKHHEKSQPTETIYVQEETSLKERVSGVAPALDLK